MSAQAETSQTNRAAPFAAGATDEAMLAARALGPMIEACADDIERDRRFPRVLSAALHEAGLLRLFLPACYGGSESHPVAYFKTIVELAHHDGSVAWNAFVANSATLLAPFLSSQAAHAIFDDPSSTVAWGPPGSHCARVDNGGYRISGEWPFASGCRLASWMGVHCRVLEADGDYRRHPDGRVKIVSLLFPAGEAELLDDWNTLGLRGTSSESYRVRDLWVSEEFCATREEPENRSIPGPLYAFTMQGLYAVGVAGVALGIADAMLEEFIGLAQQKTPRGLSRLADSALVQAEVARSTSQLEASRAWLIQTLNEIYSDFDRAQEFDVIDIPTRAQVRLTCSFAINQSVEVADRLHRLAGVDSIFPGSPFERRFRDIHTVSQQIQSRPAHFEAVGKVLLGDTPEVFY